MLKVRYRENYSLNADNSELNFQKKLSATGLRKSIPVVSILSFAHTLYTVSWDSTVKAGSTIYIEVKLKHLVCHCRFNRDLML